MPGLEPPPRRRPSTAVRSLVIAVAAVLLACSPSEPQTAPVDPVTDDGALRVVGQDDLRWNVEELTAAAGTIEFELVCEDAVNHNLVIDEVDVEVAACAPGQTVRGTVELEPGTYTYLCTVPGHERSMRGQLIVE
jgi:plastocyanin